MDDLEAPMLLFALLAACSGDADETPDTLSSETMIPSGHTGRQETTDTPTQSTDTGTTADTGLGTLELQGSRSVKGPMQKGSLAYAYRLDEVAQRSHAGVIGTIDRDGYLLLGGLTFEGWTELEVTGKYFDENTKHLSDDTITLRALGNVEGSRLEAHLNVLTGFVLERTRHLLTEDPLLGIDAARAQAVAELAIIFYTGADPTELQLSPADGAGLDIANLILLWYSAGMLDAGLDEATLRALEADFADDGLLNQSDSIAFLHATIESMTPVLLDEAVRNMEDIYGGRFADLGSHSPILSLPCAQDLEAEVPEICLPNATMDDLEPGGFYSYTFRAPQSGALIIQADYQQYNPTHKWTVFQSGSILGEANGETEHAGATTALVAGEEYVLNIFPSSLITEPTDVDVVLLTGTDGHPSDPRVLSSHSPHQGWVGFDHDPGGLSNDSYYLFYAAGIAAPTVSVREAAFDVEVAVYPAGDLSTLATASAPESPDAVATGFSSASVQAAPGDWVLVRVTNTTPAPGAYGGPQVPIRTSYTIDVY